MCVHFFKIKVDDETTCMSIPNIFCWTNSSKLTSICEFTLMEMLLYLQIPHLRPAEYKRSRLSRNRRTVNRAYGGVLSGGAVRERFVL